MSEQLVLFKPESDWVVPSRLPPIPSGVAMAVDTETLDHGLARESSAGWMIGDGYVAGASVAWLDHAEYYPIRHPDTENMDRGEVLSWLEDGMRRASRVVMHHATYDCGWLKTEGVSIPWEKIDDTQFMAVMANENELSYTLDACCRRAGVPGKDEAKLREAAVIFGLDPKRDLARMPARYSGAYAAQDARATLELREKLMPILVQQKLETAYQLEIDLLEMFDAMQRRGIRIDERQAEQSQASFRQQRADLLETLRQQLGRRRKLAVEEINSPLSLEAMFDEQKLEYPRTPRTRRGSFKAKWLQEHEHWLPRAVVKIRQLNDLAEKFIGNYMMSELHLGRVHPSVNQLRDGETGTKTYRLSYSGPPLQQIPTRTEDGRLIRACMLAEPGELWLSPDYSQQEPRMAVHFAALCQVDGYREAVAYYADDPDADFHQMVAELTGLTRKQAKIINLGLMYGMGLDKLCASLGVSLEVGAAMVKQYHERMPFIRALTDLCSSRAQARGFIRLIDGARCRFDLWEPRWQSGGGNRARALPYAAAVAAYGGAHKIKRAGSHKSMNRLVQGSAARQTKRAMLDLFRAGHTPLLQMHDEVPCSVSDPRQVAEIVEIMRAAMPLRVPMKVDAQLGWNWGQASEELKVASPRFEELMMRPGASNREIIERRAA